MKKRKLNGKAVALICAALLILLTLIKVPRLRETNKLKALGYSEEAIAAIRKNGIKKDIIKNELYSDYLNQEIVKESFDKKYYRLYIVRDILSDKDVQLYERLKELKDYSDDELLTLYGSLKYESLLPLVVFDKVDVETYVDDCLSHSANSLTTFRTSNNYLGDYSETVIEDPENVEAYVSRKFSLGEYAPDDLQTISSQNAIAGVEIRSEALDAFNQICSDARKQAKGIYAVAGYRSYETQNSIYESYGSPEDPNDDIKRPGYNELQTGLCVLVVSSENNQTNQFAATEAYKWVSENCHKYGFIIRYPDNMKSITGYDGMPYYLRYVGTDLATKIHDSKMTFDEYYYMFIYQAK